MITAVRIIVPVAIGAIGLFAAASLSWADCAADCSAAYRSCGGNPDTCLSQQGVCLNRCTLEDRRPGATEAQRHGAIAYSALKNVYGYSQDHGSSRPAADAAVADCRKKNRGASDCKVLVTFHNACGALALGNDGAYGSAWGLSQREAANKAVAACRPHGGGSCKIERQVCAGAR